MQPTRPDRLFAQRHSHLGQPKSNGFLTQIDEIIKGVCVYMERTEHDTRSTQPKTYRP